MKKILSISILVFCIIGILACSVVKKENVKNNYTNKYLSCHIPEGWDAEEDFAEHSQTFISVFDYRDDNSLAVSIDIGAIPDVIEESTSINSLIKPYHEYRHINSWDYPEDFSMDDHYKIKNIRYGDKKYKEVYELNPPSMPDDYWYYRYLYAVSGNDMYCLVVGIYGSSSENDSELMNDLNSILSSMTFNDLP
jgi:hypothetical protein